MPKKKRMVKKKRTSMKKRTQRARNMLPEGIMYQYVASMNPVVNAMKKFTTSFEKASREIRNRYDVVETCDGRWMVLIDGVQWGETRDRAGAGDLTFSTKAKAKAAARIIATETLDELIARLKRNEPLFTPEQRKNPSLMILTNPLKKRKAKRTAAPPAALQHEVRLAQKAYKSFHFKDSQKQAKRKVPDGWPRVYVILGVCDAFEVKTAQGKVKKVYSTNKPTLACTKDRKDVFIFSNSGQLGIPSGTAVRVDYTVPPNSGRVKWSRAWYHPHDSAPAAKAHKCGRAVRITGPGLSVTPRGIIG